MFFTVAQIGQTKSFYDNLRLSQVFSHFSLKGRVRWGVFSCSMQLHHLVSLNSTHWTFNCAMCLFSLNKLFKFYRKLSWQQICIFIFYVKHSGFACCYPPSLKRPLLWTWIIHRCSSRQAASTWHTHRGWTCVYMIKTNNITGLT